MSDQMLDPVQYFKEIGAKEHDGNVRSCFDSLVRESGIDEAAHRQTIQLYTQKASQLQQVRKNRNSWIFAYAALILAVLIMVGLQCYLVDMCTDYEWIGAVVLLVPQIACILFLVTRVHPACKAASAQHRQLQAEADALQKTAAEQIAPLNALLKVQDAYALVHRTIPELAFLPCCSGEHMARMTGLEGFQEADPADTSVLDARAGSFRNNPFLLARLRTHRMGTRTYSGSKTISWTETYWETETYYETEVYRDSKGNRQERSVPKTRRVEKTRDCSETLHASLTKPCPYYSQHNFLGYVHPAAPDLSFSREPQHLEKHSEAVREWIIQSNAGKLRRRSEKALRSGENLQLMNNQAFEAVFGAADRDQEVQFRTLFTPLAQRSMVQLLTGQNGYGDDFHFRKHRCYNEIRCEHGDDAFPAAVPPSAQAFSLEEAKKQFLEFHNRFFKDLFFRFAPLLAIPAYQEPAASQPVPGSAPAGHFSRYEYEALANALPREAVAPEGLRTEFLLSARLLSATDRGDIAEVTCRGYTTREHCEYISKRGSDKQWHDVPVEWTEYIPISKTITMSVEQADRANPDAEVRLHGLAGTILQS